MGLLWGCEEEEEAADPLLGEDSRPPFVKCCKMEEAGELNRRKEKIA